MKDWTRRARRAAIGALSALALVAPTADGQVLSTREAQVLAARIAPDLGVVRATVVDLPIDTRPGTRVVTAIELDGAWFTLDVSPYSVRSPKYQVFAQVESGALVEVAPSPVRTVRGVLTEVPGSQVAGGVTDLGLTAAIALPDGRRYFIEPVAAHGADAPFGAHVVYRQNDVAATGAICGNEDGRPADHDHDDDHAAAEGGADGGTIYCTELAADADREYYQSYGSSVSAVEARINTVINAVNIQYENQVDIQHQITAIVVRTAEPDPYSSTESGELLCQFIEEWTDNQQALDFDVAKLFTDKAIQGSVIGQAAAIGDICDRQGSCGFFSDDGAYCHSWNDFNGNFGCATDLAAHELGHLWNGSHCSCPTFTMNPTIACANQFSAATISDIISHRNSRTCLDQGGCPAATDGACCLSNGTCDLTDATSCASMGGVFQGIGVFCSVDVCAGACCLPDGSCEQIEGSDCTDFGGVPFGVGTTCSAELCEGACCLPSGTCQDLTAGECAAAGGAYEGLGSECATDPCPFGACCFTDGSCAVIDEALCVTAGGSYLGSGTSCAPNPCSQPNPTGACCFTDGSCTVEHEGDCTTQGGTYQGDDTACNPCPQPPDCPADIDLDGEVGFSDLLAVLSNWGPCPGCPADLDGNDEVEFGDLLAVLSNWGPC